MPRAHHGQCGVCSMPWWPGHQCSSKALEAEIERLRAVEISDWHIIMGHDEALDALIRDLTEELLTVREQERVP